MKKASSVQGVKKYESYFTGCFRIDTTPNTGKI